MDAVLDLDADERRRLVAGAVGNWQATPKIPSPADHPHLWPLPDAPGLGVYSDRNPREDGRPFCSVSHPAAGGVCGESATVEVWALPFCEIHGAEAEAAALAEMWEDACKSAEAAVQGGREAWRKNAALLYTLRRAEHEAQGNEQNRASDHEDAMQAAYADADEAHTDSDTLQYNGDPFAGSPVDWWRETRLAVCKAMREAYEGGLCHAEDLEPLREYATVQEVIALRRELSRTPA